MEHVQATGMQPSRDAAAPQTALDQLPASDHAVLKARQFRDRPVGITRLTFDTHTVRNVSRVRHPSRIAGAV
jgi:hypothetical protein